jgi:hypothetical protein
MLSRLERRWLRLLRVVTAKLENRLGIAPLLGKVYQISMVLILLKETFELNTEETFPKFVAR